MGDFRSLRVWEAAHRLTLDVYRVSESFPPSERFGLTAQVRRAAASIPANLAEGTGRNSDREIARFARIALGSANELDYHLLLARDLGLLPHVQHSELESAVRSVRRMLTRFIHQMSREPRTTPRSGSSARTDNRRPMTDDR